jgi:hypothetical protein
VIDGEDAREEEDGVEECGEDNELDGVCRSGMSDVVIACFGSRTIRQVDVECPHALAFPWRCVVSASRFQDVYEVDDILCVNGQCGTGENGKL